MAQWPYFQEPTHETGTVAASPRTTSTSGSSKEDIQKIDVVDK